MSRFLFGAAAPVVQSVSRRFAGVAANAASMCISGSVSTKHSLTALMCAGSRHEESNRVDSLFTDPMAHKLAGPEGLRNPMGSWILVPRTRFGDDLLHECYHRPKLPCRQLVLLGAGMDARAFRLQGYPELKIFEVDQPTLFEFKEPLLADEQIIVGERVTVPADFAKDEHYPNAERWERNLLAAQPKFDPTVPTLWLLEGLVYYLTDAENKRMFEAIGRLAAPGSTIFHDSITKKYVNAGIAPGGAPFVSGSDEYARLWREHAGFGSSFVRNFDSVKVDRGNRTLVLGTGNTAEATPAQCKGRELVLFIVAEKLP